MSNKSSKRDCVGYTNLPHAGHHQTVMPTTKDCSMRDTLRTAYMVCFLVIATWVAPCMGEADNSITIRLVGNLAANVVSPLTIQDIEAIGVHDVSAFNPYEKRSDKYTGVWLDHFVGNFAGPEITRLTMKAIDDYEIDFVPSDWLNLRILLVTRVNDTYIDFEHKGPLRIVFPDYDANQQIYQVNLPKWIWMITTIEFE